MTQCSFDRMLPSLFKLLVFPMYDHSWLRERERKHVSVAAVQIELEDAVATDLQRATGLGDSSKASGTTRRTLQLTGLSDTVYAEAVVILHQYDVVLDILVINRTNQTLQNLCLELATTGDLKLVERPHNYTLAEGQSTRLRANIKVWMFVVCYFAFPPACSAACLLREANEM
jgi:vesicle coat complex subunit